MIDGQKTAETLRSFLTEYQLMATSRSGTSSMPEHRNLERRLHSATPAQKSVHRNFASSIRCSQVGLVRAAFYLVIIAERRIHHVLGFKDLASYTAATAGMTPHQTRDLLRMGRRLRQLPELKEAVESGAVSWNRARQVMGRATAETEREFVDLARRQHGHALRKALRGSGDTDHESKNQPGASDQSTPETSCDMDDEMTSSRPAPRALARGGQPAPQDASTGDPPEGGHRDRELPHRDHPDRPRSEGRQASMDQPGRDQPGRDQPLPAVEPPRQHVTLSFTSEQYARWETAVDAMRKLGWTGSLGAVHVTALERAVAAGPVPPPTGSVTIASPPEVPETADTQSATAEPLAPVGVDLDPDPGTLLVILECPCCGDAVLVTSRGELPVPSALLAAAHCDGIIEEQRAAPQSGRMGGPGTTEGSGTTEEPGTTEGSGTTEEPGTTEGPGAPAESGAPEDPETPITRRHIIPPRVRRAVLRRDRYRCRAAGCGHTRRLEIHHRVPVSRGGRTCAENLITLCRRCHIRLHEQEREMSRLVEAGRRVAREVARRET